MTPKSTVKSSTPATEPLSFVMPSPILFFKTLKTYQPVSFNKQLDTFFTADRQGMAGMKIWLNYEQQLIYIKSEKDFKVVVPANVQYLEPIEP